MFGLPCSSTKQADVRFPLERWWKTKEDPYVHAYVYKTTIICDNRQRVEREREYPLEMEKKRLLSAAIEKK